jgi:hypothetical protein
VADKPYLILSDAQLPFEHEKALKFCYYLKKHYNIPNENVLNVGDEIDANTLSTHPRDPDADFTAKGEIEIVKEKVKEWASIFPQMKLCTSNHGLRLIKKAVFAELPTQALKSYKEVYGIPEKWVYKDSWSINEKHPFIVQHGLGYSGQKGHRQAAIDNGKSTIIGHLHSYAAIDYIRTANNSFWAFNSGCLIDVSSYAFSYGRWNRAKPCVGAGVIFNKGSLPMWYPIIE